MVRVIGVESRHNVYKHFGASQQSRPSRPCSLARPRIRPFRAETQGKVETRVQIPAGASETKLVSLEFWPTPGLN